MIDTHRSLGEKFLKKGFWLYLFSFIIAPIGYITKIIISGSLTVSEVGILYGVISFIMIVSAFNDFGMSESIKYFLPKFLKDNRYDKIKSLITYAFLMQVITGLLLAGFFFFGAEFLSKNYFNNLEAQNILKIFAFYFLGINVFQVLSTFFMAVQNTFAHKLSDLFRMGFILLSTLYLYITGNSSLVNYSYSWLIGLYMGIIFIVNIFYFTYYKTYFQTENILWNKQLFKEIFSYALVVCIGAQAGTILGQIDMQMVTFILGTTDAGYYTNYISIVSIPFLFIGPIFMFLFPVISELHGKNEIERIKVVKKIFVKVFIALGLMFNIFFFIFAKEIAYILFGEKFITSGTIMQYSILFLVFNFLLQINFNIMAGIGKVKERVKILGGAIIFNALVNLILLYTIGVEGAALATAMGWILIFILSEKKLGSAYKIRVDWKSIVKNILFLGIGGIFLYVFGRGLFDELNRAMSFMLLCILSCLWFIFFVGINFSMFKSFILEIKKLRGRK